MATVTSKDGTVIGYDKSGQGPPLIYVDGALGYRAWQTESPQLSALPLLTERFTIINYDRRGRGESTDTLPYAVDREIEDIEALIDAAGEPAFLYGVSSGAALAMEAALKLGHTVRKIAMYEAPYNSEDTSRKAWREYRKRLDELLAEGRRGDAVGLFMMLVGMPADELPGMRQHPMWPMFEAAAPTLAYDAAVLGQDASAPVEKAARLAVPALVLDGGASYPFMRITAVALAEAMPHGERRTLEGQTHEVAPDAIAPILVDYFCR